MKEILQSIVNIHNTLQIESRKGNTDADFVLKHLPEISKFKRGIYDKGVQSI